MATGRLLAPARPPGRHAAPEPVAAAERRPRAVPVVLALVAVVLVVVCVPGVDEFVRAAAGWVFGLLWTFCELVWSLLVAFFGGLGELVF